MQHDGADDSYREAAYGAYVAERRELNKTALELAARHDRAMLLLAGGALVVSVTFVEKIAPDPGFFSVCLLVIAWLLLLTALVTELMALSHSQRATSRQIEILDAEYAPLLYPDDDGRGDRGNLDNPFCEKVRFYNGIAQCTLVAGIVLLFVFAAFNTRKSNPDHEYKPPQAIQTGVPIQTNQGVVHSP